MFRAEVLKGCLTPKQRELGFELEEDEDFVNLLLKGEAVAIFNAKSVTVATIRETADRKSRELNKAK